MRPRSLFDDDEPEEPEPLPLRAEKPAAAAAGETRSRFCAFLKLNIEPTEKLFEPKYSMNVVAVSRGSVVELEVIACVDNPELVGHRITQADQRLKHWQWNAILFDLLERRM